MRSTKLHGFATICLLSLFLVLYNITRDSTRGVLRVNDVSKEIETESHDDSHTDNSHINLEEKCLRLRGTEGYWYRDEEFAKQTFYAHGFRSNKWARTNNPKTDVYNGNSYNWKDTSLEEQCQIHPVNLTSFCRTIQQLDVRRLFLVGDSLMAAQLGSLLGLLGLNINGYMKASRRSVITKSAIECPDYEPIQIEIYRENLGANFGKTNLTGRTDATREHRQQFGPEIPYCSGPDSNMEEGDYCPWHLRYNDTDTRTLLILNQGAHFHSIDTFSRSYDQFVTQFNSIAHPRDVVVFRTTVPGHPKCFEDGIDPSNMTHDVFLERYGTTMYDWNLFDAFNQYAKQKMDDLVPTVTSHYLNVYNMTVLRSDQHTAAKDCLHYTDPGPVDFWNHLLFTNLETFVTNYNSSRK